MVSNQASKKPTLFSSHANLWLSCFFSQRKSRTWRNSLRSWGESNNTSQKPKKSSLKKTRRATLPSSSWELQNISLPLKLTTRRRLRRSWTLFLPVSSIYLLILMILDLKKDQLKWGCYAIRLAKWATTICVLRNKSWREMQNRWAFITI